LTADGLKELGLADVDPKQVRKLDAVGNIADLQRIGRAVADDVAKHHFSGFLPDSVVSTS
jgi:hypothetical protein